MTWFSILFKSRISEVALSNGLNASWSRVHHTVSAPKALRNFEKWSKLTKQKEEEEKHCSTCLQPIFRVIPGMYPFRHSIYLMFLQSLFKFGLDVLIHWYLIFVSLKKLYTYMPQKNRTPMEHKYWIHYQRANSLDLFGPIRLLH